MAPEPTATSETQSSAEDLPAAPGPAFRPGDAAGRYTLLWLLGEGGMGQVHAAYDRQLDRKVALKLLHPRRAGLADGAGLLLREAQSMARLRHPNVVAVHDVGTLGDRVFVAMELVDGSSVRGWLAAADRGWREILDVFLAAGRGLAAAHRVGLVHRDFKPDNVLIGADGWVRVADFGLARPAETASEAVPVSAPADDGVTRSSLMAGTPRFMAPEQLAGRAAEPRSDQYAFCVALFEALYRVHPITGEAASGETRPPPRPGAVPAWLRVVILRGLSADAAARWPSMDALLVALGHDPAAGRRRWLASGGALVVAGALAVAAWSASRGRATAEPCAGAGQELAALWDGARQQRVHDAFARSGRPSAEAAYATVARAIDGQAAALTAVQRQSCQATAVRHEQSAEMLDRRTRCVERERVALAGVVDELARADAATVDAAVNAVSSLDDPAACDDLEALSAALPPPREPARARAVALVETMLAEAHLLVSFGRARPALAFAQTANAQARALGWDPLTAETELMLGVARADGDDGTGAERALTDAVNFALAGRDDDTATRAAGRLILVTAEHEHPADALRWTGLAEALLRRAGTPRPRTVGNVEFAEGFLARRRGRTAESEQHYTRALAVEEAAFGKDSPNLGAVLINLSQACRTNGKAGVAREHAARALALVRAAYGAEHPLVAGALDELAMVDLELARFADAESEARQAVAIAEATLGRDAVQTAGYVFDLADVVATSREDEALALYRRALATYLQAYGPAHVHTLQTRGRMATVLTTRGELEAAAGELEEVVKQLGAKPEPTEELCEALSNLFDVRMQQQRLAEVSSVLDRVQPLALKVYGAEHPNVMLLQVSRAEAELLAGHAAAAVALTRRSLDALRAQLGEDHPILAEVRLALGRAELAAGQADAAARDLEAAYTRFTHDHRRDTTLAQAEAPLARALWDSGGDRARAVALARTAAATLHARNKPEERDLAVLRDANDAWLATHRLP